MRGTGGPRADFFPFPESTSGIRRCSAVTALFPGVFLPHSAFTTAGFSRIRRLDHLGRVQPCWPAATSEQRDWIRLTTGPCSARSGRRQPCWPAASTVTATRYEQRTPERRSHKRRSQKGAVFHRPSRPALPRFGVGGRPGGCNPHRSHATARPFTTADEETYSGVCSQKSQTGMCPGPAK
jgi:hypothetical protein